MTRLSCANTSLFFGSGPGTLWRDSEQVAMLTRHEKAADMFIDLDIDLRSFNESAEPGPFRAYSGS
jgi:hypothetical protein